MNGLDEFFGNNAHLLSNDELIRIRDTCNYYLSSSENNEWEKVSTEIEKVDYEHCATLEKESGCNGGKSNV